MAVKLLPAREASAAYYEMGLATHYYTVYNLANCDAVCFWFTETEGILNCASCLVQEIQTLLEKKPIVVIFSDGCTSRTAMRFFRTTLFLSGFVDITNRKIKIS
ncbi:hypothetical protein HHI36_017929 [Cryptolaemus montrouzieri]|uniref:Uncharacterized protein n=1 Tax=Cryptolaemus montrouzieri TaxID=559131 RepID=A0ABD2NYU5_9CUCU